MKKVFIIISLLIAISVCAAGVILVLDGSEAADVDSEMKQLVIKQEELRRNVLIEKTVTDVGLFTSKSTCEYKVYWPLLNRINPDIIAWLYVPGTNISCPLLQERVLLEYYYLNHDYEGNRSASGSIFTPAEPLGVEDAHMLLFGHRTKNKDVAFSSLHEFFSSEDQGKLNNEVYLVYPDRTEKWELWCAVESYAEDDIYEIPYVLGSDSYAALLQSIERKYLYGTDTIPSRDDRTLIMSTCNGTVRGNERFYVVFKFIQ